MTAPPLQDVRRGTGAGPAGRGGDCREPTTRWGAGWPGDLALGVRLAVGGGRTSWARVALTALGVGLGVAVLLVAVAVPSVLDARDERGSAAVPVGPGEQGTPGGPAPLIMEWESTDFHGRWVQGWQLDVRSPTAPVPPGLTALPPDGTVVLSPALARLLASDDGEQLRPRVPWPVSGLIGDDGLVGPADLLYYRTEPGPMTFGLEVAGFGVDYPPQELPGVLWVLVWVGAVVLLLPVLVFVAAATRVAAAARERRLAALRLLGADAAQVRRIAAGEALVGSVAGLAVGGAVFLAARSLLERVVLFDVSLFAADVAPSAGSVVALAVGVPVLAVAAALVTLRRTVVEPLGVVRRGGGTPRRSLWRVLPLVAGVALLAAQHGRLAEGGGDTVAAEVAVVIGAGLVLVALPLLLPWLVERAVARRRGGPVSWQLAVRRLQLDGGTAGRVVGGLAVVLAGAVALQTLLLSAAEEWLDASSGERTLYAYADGSGAALATEATDRLTAVDGVLDTVLVDRAILFHLLPDGQEDYVDVAVGDCGQLRRIARIGACTDGDAFSVPGDGAPPPAGTVLTGDDTAGWTVPEHRPAAPAPDQDAGGLLLTRAAAAGIDPRELFLQAEVVLAAAAGVDAVEELRNVAFDVDPSMSITDEGRRSEVEQLAAVRGALLAGSVVVLALAAASLLVSGLEQLRERRRPIAVLAAAGVPRRVLAASVLWQAAVPVALALAVAVVTGLALAALVVRTVDAPLVVDPAVIALQTGLAAAAALLVTVATLPALRRATRPEGLRTG